MKKIVLLLVTVLFALLVFSCPSDSLTEQEDDEERIVSTWVNETMTIPEVAYMAWSEQLKQGDTLDITVSCHNATIDIFCADIYNFVMWDDSGAVACEPIFEQDSVITGDYTIRIPTYDIYYFVLVNSSLDYDVTVSTNVDVIRWE